MSYAKYTNAKGPHIGRVDGERIIPVSADSLCEALTKKVPDAGDAEMVPEVSFMPAMDVGGKILCVALNYVDHAKEANQPVPESPLLFFKSREAMIAAGEEIRPPSLVRQLDYEGELAIIIGKDGFNIDKREAWEYVAGATPFNDVSARDIFKVKAGDKEHLDWFSGKCIDRSTPIGPCAVPISDIMSELQSKTTRVRTLVNGEVRQDAQIRDMIFDIPTLIAFVSSRIRLSIGDVIATGTPPGVGAATGRYLSSGDVVRIEITGLPVLENRVA